jgi:hypothetical protein
MYGPYLQRIKKDQSDIHLKACNIQHFVMSSLPNLTEASKGQFTKVFHFDNKSKIEDWARRELPAVTSLHPGMS